MRQVKASAAGLALLVALFAAGQVRCTSTPDGGPDAGTTTDDADAGDGSGAADAGHQAVGYLEPCIANDDCLSGFCLPSKKCSKACVGRDECPAANGWDCHPEGSGEQMCACVPTSDTETCDGFDNNCDGTADENAKCDGASVCQDGKCQCPAENQCGNDCTDKKTDVLHCGSCDKVCGSNEICNAGQCQCPGRVCSNRCIDTQYDSANCGDCGKACGADQECVDSTCKAVDREWASWVIRPVSQFATEGDAVRDQVTGLLWTSAVSAEPLDQATAGTYCDGLDLAGYTDWRMPTRIELLSIVNYGYSQPAMDPVAFPDALSGAVWSSTPSALETGKGWAVNFQDGTATTFAATASFYVRCVR